MREHRSLPGQHHQPPHAHYRRPGAVCHPPAGRGSSTHLEPHGCTALFHRLHGILYLEDAALRAPCRHVCVILHSQGSGGGGGGRPGQCGHWQRRVAAMVAAAPATVLCNPRCKRASNCLSSCTTGMKCRGQRALKGADHDPRMILAWLRNIASPQRQGRFRRVRCQLLNATHTCPAVGKLSAGGDRQSFGAGRGCPSNTTFK